MVTAIAPPCIILRMVRCYPCSLASRVYSNRCGKTESTPRTIVIMYEAELKFTLSDSDYSRILEILVETWGETSEHVTYRGRYYDLRAGTLADTERELRLRELVRGGSRTWKLTAKAPPFDPRSRSKEEFETSVEDGEVVASILEVVGFSP